MHFTKGQAHVLRELDEIVLVFRGISGFNRVAHDSFQIDA